MLQNSLWIVTTLAWRAAVIEIWWWFHIRLFCRDFWWLFMNFKPWSPQLACYYLFSWFANGVVSEMQMMWIRIGTSYSPCGMQTYSMGISLMHAQLACHNSWWTVSSSDSLHVAKRCVEMASWHCCDGFTQPFCVLWNYFIFVMMRGLYWGNANDGKVRGKAYFLFGCWHWNPCESLWFLLAVRFGTVVWMIVTSLKW